MVILPKPHLGWTLHSCTYTMPLSDDGGVTGAGEERKVSEAQSFLLYLILGQNTPRDCP